MKSHLLLLIGLAPIYALFGGESGAMPTTIPNAIQPTGNQILPKKNILDGTVININTKPAVSQNDGKVTVDIGADKFKVLRRDQKTPETIGMGATIHPKDTPFTGDYTTSQIGLHDGTQLVLGPGTRITLDQRFFFDNNLISIIKTWNGLLRTKVSETGAKGGFSVSTTAGVCRAAQPADFVVRHFEPQKLGNLGWTRVTLIMGTIKARNNKDGKVHILNIPGQILDMGDEIFVEGGGKGKSSNGDAKALKDMLPISPVTLQIPTENNIPIPPPLFTEPPSIPPAPEDDFTIVFDIPDSNDDLILDVRPNPPSKPTDSIPTDETVVEELSP